MVPPVIMAVATPARSPGCYASTITGAMPCSPVHRRRSLFSLPSPGGGPDAAPVDLCAVFARGRRSEGASRCGHGGVAMLAIEVRTVLTGGVR